MQVSCLPVLGCIRGHARPEARGGSSALQHPSDDALLLQASACVVIPNSLLIGWLYLQVPLYGRVLVPWDMSTCGGDFRIRDF